MELRSLPTVSSIQVANLIVLFPAVGVMGLVSLGQAVSCLIGGAVMMVNIEIIRMLVRIASQSLVRRQETSGGLWKALFPFKTLLLGLVVYGLLAGLKLRPLGFLVGASTQVIAVLLATLWYALESMRASHTMAEERLQ